MESFTFNLVIDGPADQVKDFQEAVTQASTLSSGALEFTYAPWTAAALPAEGWSTAFSNVTLYDAIRRAVKHAVGSANIISQTPLQSTAGSDAEIIYEVEVVSVPLNELEETSRLHPDLTFTATYTAPSGPPMQSQWIAGGWTMEHSAIAPVHF